MKKVICIILAVFMCLTMFACKKAEDIEPAPSPKPSADVAPSAEPEKTAEAVTIVYTNDIHCYIDNTVTVDREDGTSETLPGLRLSKIAQMVVDMRAEGRNVLLVDAGDELQGNAFGSTDKGASIIELMNSAGYQLATPGNHDFDYGSDRLMTAISEADFPYISCNLRYTESGETVLEPYKIFDLNGTKVAFIGISTPETISCSTPAFFMNEDGTFRYSFDGMTDPEALYSTVQTAVDEVRGEADYVIALAHTGVSVACSKMGYASTDIIENTTGIDAYIDAHSHTAIDDVIKNKDGEDVVLSQTGGYLSSVGVITIDEHGSISTELLADYDGADPDIAAKEELLISNLNEALSEKVAVLEAPLLITNPDNDQQRLVRAMEMNSGDFCADSVYWYFNEAKDMPCDVAIANGGGVRASIPAGDVTNADVKAISPFGNVVCLINATGQQILDALEMGVQLVGEWDEQRDSPAEFGGFLHVAGIRFTVDSSVECSVELDENSFFTGVDGEYRVKDAEVYNRETGVYEPLDPDRVYSVGGINYILRNNGNGMSMFADCDTIVDFVGQDWDILTEYIKSFTEVDGYPLINTAGSPLSAYSGYLIDYEAPYGAGRIIEK